MSGVVWITGASAGIGRATALEFARRGWRVVATARRAELLKELEQESEGLLGDVTAYPGDVTDGAGMARVIAAIEEELGAISSAVLNAGSFWSMTARDFRAEVIRKTFELNVMGTANPLEHLLPRMIERGAGKIYVVASVSGYRGLPTAASYGMSKAGLINMCEALYGELKPLGVTVGVVNPGFVETPLTDRNRFPMPFLMKADKAASALVDGVLDGGFEIYFPRRFVWILKLTRILPYGLYFPLVRRATRSRSD